LTVEINAFLFSKRAHRANILVKALIRYLSKSLNLI